MLVLPSRGAFKTPKACTFIHTHCCRGWWKTIGYWYRGHLVSHNGVAKELFSSAHTNNGDDMANINYYMHVDLLIP
jgi:hypothetical protein